MKHVTQDDLTLHHFGELPSAEIDRHLAECADCKAAHAEIGRLLAVVEQLPIPERGPDYAERVIRRVEARVAERSASKPGWLSFFSMPRLALASGLTAALFLAFLLGRSTVPVAGDPVPEVVKERILLVAVGDHLDRSQRMLVELVHAEQPADFDFAGSRDLAASLAQRNRLYRQTATNRGDETVADLLTELERLLVEIANGPEEMDGLELARLRSRVQRQGILMKIEIIGNDAKQREKSAAGDRLRL